MYFASNVLSETIYHSRGVRVPVTFRRRYVFRYDVRRVTRRNI